MNTVKEKYLLLADAIVSALASRGPAAGRHAEIRKRFRLLYGRAALKRAVAGRQGIK